MENMTRKIKLHAQEVRKDKQVFIACSASINGNWYKIKFTKGCEGAPKSKGLYSLTVDLDSCSIERGKQYTNTNGEQRKSNDIIWVRNIVELRKHTEEDLKAANRITMAAIFGNGEDELSM